MARRCHAKLNRYGAEENIAFESSHHFQCGCRKYSRDQLAPAYGQSEAAIRGELVAHADGSPLVQGTVTLRSPVTGAPMQTTVDAAGRFMFSNLSPGECVLPASSDGFAHRDVRVVLAPRELRTVDIAFAVAAIAVNVNVTAEVRQLPTTHLPSSTVLTADWLDTLPIAQRAVLNGARVTHPIAGVGDDFQDNPFYERDGHRASHRR